MNLCEQGLTDIIVTVLHLVEHIMNCYEDSKAFEVHIEYYMEDRLLGNADTLFRSQNRLDDVFLLLNGNVIFDINFDRFVIFHKRKSGLVILFTHPNNHPYDNGLLIIGSNEAVTQWLGRENIRPKWYKM